MSVHSTMSSTNPSESPCADTSSPTTLFQFLGNNDYRKQFNKITKCSKEYHQIQARTVLLQKCIDEKTIPNFFKVKNKSNDTSNEGATNLSIEWMKTALEDAQREAGLKLENMATQYNLLIVCTPDHLQEELKAKVIERGKGFKAFFTSQKLDRYESIKKQKNPQKNTQNAQNPEKNNKTTKRKWIKRSQYQRLSRKKNKANITMVYNYSSITLTDAMEKLLNRGLNFSPTPKNLDFTQLLVDFKYFARNMFWTEFFWDMEQREEQKPGIFKKAKKN